MAIEYVIEDDIDISKEGALCIPSKLLTSYIGLVSEDTITLELMGDDSIQVSSTSGKIKIK